MSVIFQSVIATILSLKRTCPKCGRSQVVPSKMKKEEVPCRSCGAEIPPKN